MVADRRIAVRAGAAAACLAAVVLAFVAGRAAASHRSARVGPGPYRVVDGVTVRFAHSAAGAEAAAAHYLLEIERAMDSLRVGRAVLIARLVGTAGEARSIAARAASVIAVERGAGAPLRRVAIATDPVSYSPTAARVTVLEQWIYATTQREALWAIERVGLVWQAGGWRVAAITGAAASADESLGVLRAQLEFPGPGDASVR